MHRRYLAKYRISRLIKLGKKELSKILNKDSRSTYTIWDKRQIKLTKKKDLRKLRAVTHDEIFKGIVSRVTTWIFCFEGLNILVSTFCICADCFQYLSKAFHYGYPIKLPTFYLLLWNYLLFSKILTETLLKIPFSVIGRCSLVLTSHWLQGKCARIKSSQAASGMTLQNHRRLPVSNFNVKIATLGSLKRVTGRIFKIGN